MSKAFTREADDLPERPVVPRRISPLPPGTANYVTPAGAEKLRVELARLRGQNVPASDARVQHLQQSLQSAVVVPRPTTPEDRVRFGATVTVRDRRGETTYRLVGVDEADPECGWVSWQSPIAKALLNTRVGDRVRFRDQDLEVVRVEYE